MFSICLSSSLWLKAVIFALPVYVMVQGSIASQCNRIGLGTTTTLSLSTLSMNNTLDCSLKGHWPIKKSCQSINSDIFFDPDNLQLFYSGQVQEEGVHNTKESHLILDTWNISRMNTPYSPKCAVYIPHAIFMPIAFDEVAYQTEGSNYYVTHTDSLIPLWNFLKKFRKLFPQKILPEIFLFAFNVEGKIDLVSPAFDDFSKYWIQSLQLLLGDSQQLQMGTLYALEQYFHVAMHTLQDSIFEGFSYTGGRGNLCFGEIQFGVPQYYPTSRAVKSFSHDYRQAVLKYSKYAFSSRKDATHVVSNGAKMIDTVSKQLCASAVKRIGVVVRKGRRKIANVDSFLEELSGLGDKWCATTFHPTLNQKNMKCKVLFERATFGNEWESETLDTYNMSSTVERDVIPLQDYAVLFGIQGSGLINALYMSPVSTAVAVYLNDGWPISSADPLAVLGDRGPYMVYINNDPTKIICNLEKDKFCDSGDMIMDADTFEPIFIEALNRHIKECEAIL